jgi:hypothetical protein
MDRPKPQPPLDVTPFLELIDEDMYPCRSGGINHAGTSTTAVLLVFGPDAEEVQAVNDRLTAALLDHISGSRPKAHPLTSDRAPVMRQ